MSKATKEKGRCDTPPATPVTLSSSEREQLQVHEAARHFPDIPTKEYWEFRADLIANGMSVPMLVSKDHKRLLDGRHRWRACKEAPNHIKPLFAEFQGKEEDEPGEIFRLNYHRCQLQLTDDQRTALVSKFRGPQYEAEAQARIEARQFGTRDTRENTAPLKSTEPDESIDFGETTDKIAAEAKTTRYKARQAEQLRKDDPEALDEVIEGEKKLREAAKPKPPKGKGKTEQRRKPSWRDTLEGRVEHYYGKAINGLFGAARLKAKQRLVYHLFAIEHSEKGEVVPEHVTYPDGSKFAIDEVLGKPAAIRLKSDKRAPLKPTKSIDITAAVGHGKQKRGQP